MMGIFPDKRPDGKFRKRLRRHLYYADQADMSLPSLPLTEFAVDYFHDCSPKKLGHVDLETASNIVRENKVKPCSVVTSLLYAKRLRQKSQQYLESMSSSDIFFISMMMASKYIYDEGTEDEVYNDEWAVTVDQDVDQVNKMEVEFLDAMDWKLFVRPEEFDEALDAIEKRLAIKHGLQRGWFTYAELDILSGPDILHSLWRNVGSECSKLLSSLCAAYVAGVISMLGSVVLASQVAVPLSSAAVAMISSPAANSMLSLLVTSGRTFGLIPPTTDIPIPSADLPWSERVPESAKTLSQDVVRAGNEMYIGDGKMAFCRDLNNIKSAGNGFEFDPVQLSKQNETLVEDNTDQRQSQRETTELIKKEDGAEIVWMKKPDNAAENDQGDIDMKQSGPEVSSSLPSEKPPTSSLWSLWFVDSLLSQIWALSYSPRPSSNNKDSLPTCGSCRNSGLNAEDDCFRCTNFCKVCGDQPTGILDEQSLGCNHCSRLRGNEARKRKETKSPHGFIRKSRKSCSNGGSLSPAQAKALKPSFDGNPAMNHGKEIRCCDCGLNVNRSSNPPSTFGLLSSLLASVLGQESSTNSGRGNLNSHGEGRHTCRSCNLKNPSNTGLKPTPCRDYFCAYLTTNIGKESNHSLNGAVGETIGGKFQEHLNPSLLSHCPHACLQPHDHSCFNHQHPERLPTDNPPSDYISSLFSTSGFLPGVLQTLQAA